MTARNSLVLLLACCVFLIRTSSAAEPAGETTTRFHGALLAADQVTTTRLDSLTSGNVTAITLMLSSGADARAAEYKAVDLIRKFGLQLYYWIEVARCSELADAHPEWMASLQGHSEWRRLFKDLPTPNADEVVKTYPWVPILNKEPFNAQLQRIRKLLAGRPEADGVFLNDLQGAPSACGCGNHLCRWTSDYGKVRTATPLGNDAPAAFTAAVRRLVPKSEVIPVWTTECEEHDGAATGLCAGVGCFKGICWKAYTEQLEPVAEQSGTLGVLVPYRAFQRNTPNYGGEAAWIADAVKSFQTMPIRYQRKPIPSSRLVTVLQGWEVSNQQIAAQIDVARKAGVTGILIAYIKVDQGWQPRIMKYK